MKLRLIPVIGITFLAIESTAPLSAATTNLFPVADSAMTDSLPNSNFGTALQLPVGVSIPGDVHYCALFKFDLSVIPPNATVTNVTLKLIVVQNMRPPAYFDLNLLFTNWVESEVTWNNRAASAPWTAPGAQSGTDYSSVAHAFAEINVTGTTNAFSGPGLVSDVQTWVIDPASNFGWILTADADLAGSGKQVGSRENTGNEPVLTVDYTAPLAPVVLKALGITNGVFNFSFNTEANHGYAIQSIGNLANTNWTTFLTLDPGPAGGEAVIPSSVTSSNRFFRVVVF